MSAGVVRTSELLFFHEKSEPIELSRSVIWPVRSVAADGLLEWERCGVIFGKFAGLHESQDRLSDYVPADRKIRWTFFVPLMLNVLVEQFLF